MIKLKLEDDTRDILLTVYKTRLRKGGKPPTQNAQLAAAISYLAENYAASEPDETAPPRARPTLPSDIEAALRRVTSPDVSLPVLLQHNKTTPRATDGLVPWEYVIAGYNNCDFVQEADTDVKIELVRTILTRIPEDTWESEHTRSIMQRAFQEVR